MENGESHVVLRRQLNAVTRGGITLLDATCSPDQGNRKISLFFKSDTPQDRFKGANGLEVVGSRSIGNGPLLSCMVAGGTGDIEDTGPLAVFVGDIGFDLDIRPSEPELFAGMNVIFAVRNGESAQITVQWLRYHVDHHGMEAALILDRARPDAGQDYFDEVKKQAAKIKGLKRLVLWTADVPLGQADLPAESHPFNAPGAPGKDRMEIPKADPWASPLGEVLIYEIARARFLNTARAVANIELYDLLAPHSGDNVFDRTDASQTGCIQLEGTQIYPWRIRKNDPCTFGDHVCVQFDGGAARMRWCVSPRKAGDQAVWRLIRVVGTNPSADEFATFNRYMSLRFLTETVSKIVPKTSLIEAPELIQQAKTMFGHKPVRMPKETLVKSTVETPRTAIVTTMKNEGPFILEWIAYHRVIGVDDFLIYTNDCTDGTDAMLQLLQQKGLVQHRENPFKETDLKPQHAALQAADSEPVIKNADWLICMDVDEFINVKCGDGRLADLYAAVGEANMIAITWRLFGNSDIHEFQDGLILDTYDQSALELTRKPHQAWGFKTLFHNVGIFKKMGVHRPKGLKSQLWEDINWVNGSGKPMPSDMYRNGWRSTSGTYGYDLVQLNHYAVRCAESFLVKRDRGRVNHVDRDQGMAYWFRMNNNAQKETSIQRMLPALRAEMDRLMSDPEIAAAHAYSVTKHSEKIKELKAGDNYNAFYRELTNPRLENLSKLHAHFGANVFLMGPEVIPDDIANKAPEDEFFFTVEKGETNH